MQVGAILLKDHLVYLAGLLISAYYIHIEYCLRQPFPLGQKVTVTGTQHLCQKCLTAVASAKLPSKIKDDHLIDSVQPMPLSPTGIYCLYSM